MFERTSAGKMARLIGGRERRPAGVDDPAPGCGRRQRAEVTVTSEAGGFPGNVIHGNRTSVRFNLSVSTA